MGTAINVKIDGKRLRATIERNGMTMADMSRAIGRNEAYMSAAVSRNSIGRPELKLLCMRIGVDESFFEIK